MFSPGALRTGVGPPRPPGPVVQGAPPPAQSPAPPRSAAGRGSAHPPQIVAGEGDISGPDRRSAELNRLQQTGRGPGPFGRRGVPRGMPPLFRAQAHGAKQRSLSPSTHGGPLPPAGARRTSRVYRPAPTQGLSRHLLRLPVRPACCRSFGIRSHPLKPAGPASAAAHSRPLPPHLLRAGPAPLRPDLQAGRRLTPAGEVRQAAQRPEGHFPRAPAALFRWAARRLRPGTRGFPPAARPPHRRRHPRRPASSRQAPRRSPRPPGRHLLRTTKGVQSRAIRPGHRRPGALRDDQDCCLQPAPGLCPPGPFGLHPSFPGCRPGLLPAWRQGPLRFAATSGKIPSCRRPRNRPSAPP